MLESLTMLRVLENLLLLEITTQLAVQGLARMDTFGGWGVGLTAKRCLSPWACYIRLIANKW
jgi:hypothetical protein